MTERLAEIERRGSADVVTEEKMARIDRSLDEQKRTLDRLMVKQARPRSGRRRGRETSAVRQAFDAYVRRGDEAALRQSELKAMSAGSDPDGGYLVPDELDTEIGRRLSELSPVRSIATVRQVSGAVLKKPFALERHGHRLGRRDRRAAADRAPQLAELQFPTMELYAMPAATASLIEDSAVDIEGWIASEVEAAFAEQEGAAFVAGDGVNKPRGFLDYPSVADSELELGQSRPHVATGAAGAFGTDPSDRLVELIYALKAGHRQNGRFVMNRKTQSQIRKFKDADGNYLWMPPAGAGQAASLMGFPVVEAEDMPDVAANSAWRWPSATSAAAIWWSTGPACASCAIPILPSPMCCSTPPSASAAGCCSAQNRMAHRARSLGIQCSGQNTDASTTRLATGS
jgi:HK97 family phage major capsid protein